MQYQQPQAGPLTADRGTPYSVGLSFGFVPSGAFNNGGVPIGNTYTAGVVQTPGIRGMAMDIASTSSQNGLTVSGGIDLSLQTGGCTLIVVADGITPGVGSAQGFIGPDTSNFFGYDTSGFPIIKAGGSTQSTSSVALSTTSPNVIAYTYMRGSTAKIYLNGVLVANATPSAVGIDYKPTLFGHTSATSTHGRHRIYGAALFSRRMLDDAAVAVLSANLWQIFLDEDEEDEGLFRSAGGPQSLTVTPTGGIAFSGAAPVVRSTARTASGGITFSGSAPMIRGAARAAAGGLTFAGAAPVVRGKTLVPSGGLQFGGTAPFTGNSSSQQLVVTPAGGIVFSGSAPVVRKMTALTSGGIVFSGSAPYTNSGVVAPTFEFKRRRILRRDF